MRRYHVIGFALTTDVPESSSSAACVTILSNSRVVSLLQRQRHTTHYELGKTKIFLKYYVVDILTQVSIYSRFFELLDSSS